MLRAPRSERHWLSRCVAIALGLGLAGGISAAEEPGDVYVSVENDDSRASRFGTELLWVQPLTAWLDAETGGRYAEFDGARWGYGILGARVALPGGRDHLAARYQGGAGDGGAGHYAHHVGELSWHRELFPRRVYFDAGLRWIRAGDVRDDLGRLGLVLGATDWLFLTGGHHRSLPGGEGTEAWTGRVDLQLLGRPVFAGYARSRDTVDLRSIGRGRVRGEPTDEFSLGTTLPVGRHAVTLTASRYESALDTRHTLGLTWRWSLAAAPWDLGAAPE